MVYFIQKLVPGVTGVIPEIAYTISLWKSDFSFLDKFTRNHLAGNNLINRNGFQNEILSLTSYIQKLSIFID